MRTINGLKIDWEKVLKGLSQTKDIEQMGGHLGKASYKVGILPYYLMPLTNVIN